MLPEFKYFIFTTTNTRLPPQTQTITRYTHFIKTNTYPQTGLKWTLIKRRYAYFSFFFFLFCKRRLYSCFFIKYGKSFIHIKKYVQLYTEHTQRVKKPEVPIHQKSKCGTTVQENKKNHLYKRIYNKGHTTSGPNNSISSEFVMQSFHACLRSGPSKNKIH